MLNRSKLAAVALLAAVFLAGGLAGWGGHEAAERDEGRPRRRGPDAMVEYLSRELKLTDAQRDSVRAIFSRHRPETDSLWARVRPQFDSIKARMRAEIDAQLTPEQRTLHQQLIERAEHRSKGSPERGGRH
jgi:Spy/CpxP family protein refolding chaperone